jgi:hypothetical protein
MITSQDFTFFIVEEPITSAAEAALYQADLRHVPCPTEFWTVPIELVALPRHRALPLDAIVTFVMCAEWSWLPVCARLTSIILIESSIAVAHANLQ